MPAITPHDKPVAVGDLHVIRRYEVGLVAVDNTHLLVLQVEDRDQERTYVTSLTSAVQLAADINAVLESDPAIRALVAETLATARSMKVTHASSEADIAREVHDSAPCICDVCGYTVADHAHEAVDRACAAAKEG